MIKICNRCGVSKDIDEFYRDKRKKDGHRSICKQCCGNSYKKWQQNNPEKVRANNKKACSKFKNTIEYRFWKTRSGAKQRKIIFNLSFEEFKNIVKNDCFYCGGKDRIGLDRVDSDYGYFKDNIVAACYRCNVAKNNMTQTEFIDLCKKVVKNNENNYPI